MPLTEEDSLDRLAEALYIEKMELSTDIQAVVSIVLDNLRFFKMLCESEKISFDEITPALLVKKFTGRNVRHEDLLAARMEVEERIKNDQLLKPRAICKS